MQTKPNINLRQGIVPSLFDFADVADPAECERLLMEELCRTQSALAKAKDEIGREQRTLAERAFEREAADARDLLHAA